MRERHPNLIVPIGTQVVTRVEVAPSGGGSPLPKGIVGELIKIPADAAHAYRVRFPDGAEGNVRRHEFSLLKHVKTGPLGDRDRVLKDFDLYEFVIYRCIVGSHAYGRREYDRLRTELESASERSHLPEAPSAREALSDLLVRLRHSTYNHAARRRRS